MRWLEGLVRRTIKGSEASSLYGIAAGTLANLRSQKKGPKFYKSGRMVFYKVEDFEAWLLQNPVETLDSLLEGRGKCLIP